jgi:hypothetical protein
MAKDYYFTFVGCRKNDSGYVKVRANNDVDARMKMNTIYSNRWCMMYTDISDIHPDDRRCIETII